MKRYSGSDFTHWLTTTYVLIDARTGKLLWRGWEQAQSDDNLLTLGKVPDAVKTILRDFAPNQAIAGNTL